MTNIDHAWASGFFDGEGCVTIVTVNNSWQIRLFATQNDVRPLFKFQQLFGGRIDKPGTNSQYQYSVWIATSGLAIDVAKCLLPYAVYKKEQLEIVIDLWNEFPSLKGGKAIHASNKDEREMAFAIASVRLVNLKKAFVTHADIEATLSE
jgi:hypothetical protein